MDDNKQPVELNEGEPEEILTEEDAIEFFQTVLDNVKHFLEDIIVSESDLEFFKTTGSVLEELDDFEKEELYALYLPDVEKRREKYMAFIEKIKERKGLKNADMLPTLQSKCPEWHTMPIEKLVSVLCNNTCAIINAGETGIAVANKGKKGNIITYVLATYGEVDGTTSLTEFDRQVHDAVSSLWEYGHESHVITPDMVARTMTHKTQSEKVSKQFKEAVTRSIEKMWAVRIEIDASEEIKKRKVIQDEQPVLKFVYKGDLLALERIEVGAGGKTVTGYHILREPVLLSYAKMTKQLATVGAELLDVKEVDKKTGKATEVSIKNSEDRIAVNGYLLRRIAVMKNDRKKKNPAQSNIILFSTLFEETGIPQDSHAKRIKDYVFQVLDYYKAEKYIKGYAKRKKGKGGGFDAVIIDL